MPPSVGKRSSTVSVARSRVSRVELDLDFMKSRQLGLKPEDQLQLNETELSEEIARELLPTNTRVPNNIVEWSYKNREFIKIPPPPTIAPILDVHGTMVHKDSDEAKRQSLGADADEDEGEEEKQEDEDEGIEDDDDKSSATEKTEPEPEEDKGGDAGADDAEDEEEVDKKPKKVPNQFNFCERAALTYEDPVRDMSTQTVPPPTDNCAGTIHQWTIYDDYQEDFAAQQREKEKGKEKKTGPGKQHDSKKKAQSENSAMNARMFELSKTLERMVNQNIYDEISQDYRYWDDPSDEFKDGEGSLLPLWKLSYEKTKKHDVTDLCFNTRYYDLFAVGFGSMTYDNIAPNGAICLFTLKNPSYPEWICFTESPVMCLDFHPNYPHLLAVGAMDGSVSVYNVQLPPSHPPQYRSNEVTQKHDGIVWQVVWAPDTEEGQMTFFSVSIDGKINHWVLKQSELGHTTVMTLYLEMPPIPGPDGTLIALKSCGTCIAFHPDDPNVFLVGTEEGTIYKCNTAYSSVYMRTYKSAHNMPVYRIVFNKYDSSIFASCSGDWRVKIWEDERPDPLFMFDLGVPIGDVQWAPYSSTVLACVSNDGKVTVFDLNVNKYRPICSQAVVSKRRNKLTRLAFNTTLPFIIVGDDKGSVNAMKLSPNLRIKSKPSKKQIGMTPEEMEKSKLEKLLSFVREPPVLTRPKDVRDID